MTRRWVLVGLAVLGLGAASWAVWGRGEVSAVRDREAPSENVPPESDEPDADARAVREALLLADAQVERDIEVLDAARLFNKALLDHPRRAREAAAVLGELTDRRLAFRVALLVGRYLTDPVVYQRMLEQLAHGGNHAREVAAYAFYGWRGDVTLARTLAHTVADPQASERVRAAQAWALSRSLADLPPVEQEVAREVARSIVDRAEGGPELRAEAIGLLDPLGADRKRLERVLRETSELKVALAAARMLLTRGGADEREVLAELERFAVGADPSDWTARTLGTVIEQRQRRLAELEHARASAPSVNASSEH